MHPAEFVGFVAAIGILFASAEALRRRGVSGAATRRYTHAVGASVAAILPGLLSLGEVLALAAVVAVALAWTRSRGLLSAVHGVERPTLGATLFPIGLGLAALIAWPVPQAYVVAALVFALADPAASLVGGAVRSPSWNAVGGLKSLAGSLAFVAVALGVMLAAHALGAGVGPTTALMIALGLAAVEGALGFGVDNLAVPPLAAVALRGALGG